MERTTCLQIGSDNFTVTIITLYFIPPSFVQNHFFSPKPKSCFENFFSGFDNDYNPRLFRPFIPFSRPPPFLPPIHPARLFFSSPEHTTAPFSLSNVLKPLYPHTFSLPRCIHRQQSNLLTPNSTQISTQNIMLICVTRQDTLKLLFTKTVSLVLPDF